MTDASNPMTDFGFQRVAVSEKTAQVAEVFHSVAPHYDLMNDLMSWGLHRVWKRFAIHLCRIRPGHTVLDLAGGTGDLALRIRSLVGPEGQVVLGDINAAMLTIGYDRWIDQGAPAPMAFIQANAETLPFLDHSFDCVIMGFGLRNTTHPHRVLTDIQRVLKPGGRCIILEFSKPVLPGLQALYEVYSFKVLPWLGKKIAHDERSYRYLVESIERHPDQHTLKQMMDAAGLENCDYHNISGGIIAVHRGYKF